MSFLFPLAWWLGLLGLPVIAFYLLKTRQRRKPVSTLIFWQQIKPKIENSPFWRKLRRWLSLALQLLILALVIAAIARPAFSWEKKQAQQVVAILDNSASMQSTSPAPSRWKNSVDGLADTISRLRVQDEMAILTAEDPPRLLSGWTSSKRALRDALVKVGELNTGTNPEASFALARELTATRENARIEVFSDSVWPNSAGEAAKTGLVVRGVDDKLPTNAGLTLFAVRRSPTSPGDWQIDAEVASSNVFSGRLELLKDGQPMDLATVESAPGKPWRKTWRGSSEGGAEFEAVLQVAGDDMLPVDNRARCTLTPLKALRVIVTGPPDPFLEAVLDSIPLVNWSRVFLYPLAMPSDVDLVIAGGENLPEKPQKVPVLFLNPVKGGDWGELKGSLKDVPVTDLDKSSPLLLHAGLGAVAIEEAGEWVSPAGAEVLASSMGHPLIFGQWDRQPRWLVVGFDPVKSDLPLRTAFPVLMANLLQSLRGDADLKKGAAVLPGRVESDLAPLMAPTSEARIDRSLVWPGWWLVLLVALAIVVGEWYLYNRRITD